MKKNLEAGSREIRYSHNALSTRLTPSRIIVGVLATSLLLFSLIGAIATVTRSHATAATAANSVTNHNLAPADDTSTPTTTTTSTPSPTSTSTPSPTTTSTPSPTSTSTSTPTPTTTSTSTPSPTSTSTASSTPSISPTRSTDSNAASSPTAGTITPGASQSSGQDQTPTSATTSNTTTSTSQGQQSGGSQFTPLAIGLPGSAAAIIFFFIGWRLLRKRLLPVKKVKLPPSGAGPWSRVRTSDTPWNVNTNGSTLPNGSFASKEQHSFNGSNQIYNTQVMPMPGKPEPNRTQAMGNSYEMDAYEQWLRNNPGGTPDINDPYLKELIRQYSDKSRAARRQKMGSARDGQASSTRNDASWLR